MSDGLGAAAFSHESFRREVAMVVALHADARRYLGRTDPGCVRVWSAATVRSLAGQDGSEAPPEIRVYVSLPADEAALDLRRWDEAALVPGRVVRGIRPLPLTAWIG